MATQNESQQQQQKDQQSRSEQPQSEQQQTATSQRAVAQPQTGTQQQAGSATATSGAMTTTSKGVQPRIRTSSERPARRASLFGDGRLLTPWELMRRVNEELDHLVGAVEMQRSDGIQATPRSNAARSAASDTRGAGDLTSTEWIPRIDVVERNGAMVLRADLAGIHPDDIVVNIESGVLSIWGERQREQREENDRVVRAERVYGSFFRSIPLPDGADEEHVTAEFRNGVLELTIPVSQRERGRRIAVRS